MSGQGVTESEWHLDWTSILAPPGASRAAARVLTLAGDAVTLRSSVASPPGSRIEGALRTSGEKVRFKIHGAKKQADGTFVLEGRLVDATRELRSTLAALCAPSARDPSRDPSNEGGNPGPVPPAAK